MNKLMKAHNLFNKHVWLNIGETHNNNDNDSNILRIYSCECGMYKIFNLGLYSVDKHTIIEYVKKWKIIPDDVNEENISIE